MPTEPHTASLADLSAPARTMDDRPLTCRSRLWRGIRAAAFLVAGLVLAACGTPERIDTPMLDTRNPELTVNHRVRAAELAWAGAQADPDSHEKARAIFKNLVWSTETPRPLRLNLAEYLLTDDSPAGLADSRRFTMLRLPTEPDRAVVGMMSLAAARHGWTDAAPSLIRRLADPIEGIPDAERSEALALQRLYPGRSLQRIVFDVFIDPSVEGAPAEIGWDERVRADAWTLLSRLDPDGGARRGLIRDPGPAASGSAGRVLGNLRAADRDLGVVPSTAMELEWIEALRNPRNSGGAAWWAETAALVSGLDDSRARGLCLRHLEPIRVASHTRPRLLTADRETLLDELDARLENRDHHRRTAETSGSNSGLKERLDDWRETLTWGDALALIVVDDALRAGSVAPTIFEQAVLDREDRTTEYGGVIEAVNAPDGSVGGVRAVLFLPRQRDRVSDERFIASRDMIDYSPRSLAHYHLQVQKPRNYQYAGPSIGDLRYARTSGRTCLVFTSLSEDRLGVDLYQPNGVVIDLGELSR